MIIRLCLIFLALSVLPLSARAAEFSCDKLKDKATYKKEDAYKYLVEEKDGWIFRTGKDFEEEFKLNSAGVDRFTRLNKALERQGIKLIIALLPTRGMMHEGMAAREGYNQQAAIESYKSLAKKIGETGVMVAEVEDFTGKTDYFYKRDHHWSPVGAKDMAQTVAAKIKELPTYAEIEKKVFKTESGEQIDHNGTFAKFISETCGMDIPPEKVTKYTTYADDDLLGDTSAKPADIILVGTSNSTPEASHANFDGFLREYIGADVDNRAVSGGGVDSAILNWLASDDYKAHKPKILIWEFPVYQDYDSGPFYRQLIPAVYGICDKPLASDTAALSETELQLMDNLSGQKIEGKDKYLALKFDGLKEKKFRVLMTYADGQKKTMDIKRDKRDERHGQFFIEFEETPGNPLESIGLRLKTAEEGGVEARICTETE